MEKTTSWDLLDFLEPHTEARKQDEFLHIWNRTQSQLCGQVPHMVSHWDWSLKHLLGSEEFLSPTHHEWPLAVNIRDVLHMLNNSHPTSGISWVSDSEHIHLTSASCFLTLLLQGYSSWLNPNSSILQNLTLGINRQRTECLRCRALHDIIKISDPFIPHFVSLLIRLPFLHRLKFSIKGLGVYVNTSLILVIRDKVRNSV